MKMAGNMWLTMIYHRFWFTNCRCSYPITKVLSGGTMPLVYGLWSSIPWEYPSIWVTMVPQFTCEIPDLKTSKWVTSQETLTLLVSVISAMIITNLKYQTSYIILLSWWVYFSMVKIKLLAFPKNKCNNLWFTTAPGPSLPQPLFAGHWHHGAFLSPQQVPKAAAGLR